MRNFRWTPKRDRALLESVADLFTVKECAALVGGGCTEADAKARLKVLRAAQADTAMVEPVADSAAVIEPAPVPAPAPAPAPAPVPVRRPPAVLLQLPRYGEMEKRFNPALRGLK